MKIQELQNDSYLTEVDWEGEFSDTKKTCVTADQLAKEMNDELDRVNTKASQRKSRSLNVAIHTRGNIGKSLEDGDLNVEKFKKLITTSPNNIFDKNPKMEKSDEAGVQYVVNTGIPAIVGIIYDQEHDKFYKINTCPGAGACKIVCYARRGFYGLSDGKSMKLIRRLNLLMNDPNEYYSMIMDELEVTLVKIRQTDRRSGGKTQLVIRWNDAGDFFSDKYFKIAIRVTQELIKDGHNVKSYAYTKRGKYMNLADSSFVMNFSSDASLKELKKVDIKKTKNSIIVPKASFNDIFQKKGAHFVKNEQTGLPEFVSNATKQELKARLAKEYKVPVKSIIYQYELPHKEGKVGQYNAIVLPTGDSDRSAQRPDVRITFLLQH